MADPEQIYQEVLSEEQGKGVTPAVAEARAKSARARAEHGSPHPKEPKWWPGAQPHFEGGGGDAPAEEEEAPAEEPPAEEATADVQAPEVEQDAPAASPEPATEEPVAPAAAGAPAPAPQAVPQEPAAAQPAAAAAQPAAAATQTVIPQTTGVSHGTTTGTRLRPEDEVATEAQFEGQKAMYERRKLIDDLVASGVPQVTAYDTDRPRSPALAILYLLIPLLAIFLIATNDNGSEATADSGTETTETGGGEEGQGEGGGGDSSTLVAANIEWDTDTLTFKAGEPAQLTLDNEDSTVHNMSIYKDQTAAESQSDPLFKGEDVDPGASADYEIDPLDKGTYTFICDYHINMIGEVEVQ